MPHSSRRNRKAFHNKRILAETEDGWQRVERTVPVPRHDTTVTIQESLPPVDRSLSVEKLQDEHKRCKQQWIQSDARKSVAQLLERRMPSGGWPLDKAVCIALGSPSLSWANRTRSVWQLVFFMDVVEMIKSNINHGHQLTIFAQEPRFTSLDKAFFHTLDITVLESPEAEELTDSSTFTFIPCLEWTSEIPFIINARDSPLYVTSSLRWVVEEAERMKVQYQHMDETSRPAKRLKDCHDASAASKHVLDTHDEYRTTTTEFADGHSLNFSIYTLKQEDD